MSEFSEVETVSGRVVVRALANGLPVEHTCQDAETGDKQRLTVTPDNHGLVVECNDVQSSVVIDVSGGDVRLCVDDGFGETRILQVLDRVDSSGPSGYVVGSKSEALNNLHCMLQEFEAGGVDSFDFQLAYGVIESVRDNPGEES